MCGRGFIASKESPTAVYQTAAGLLHSSDAKPSQFDFTAIAYTFIAGETKYFFGINRSIAKAIKMLHHVISC